MLNMTKRNLVIEPQRYSIHKIFFELTLSYSYIIPSNVIFDKEYTAFILINTVIQGHKSYTYTVWTQYHFSPVCTVLMSFNQYHKKKTDDPSVYVSIHRFMHRSIGSCIDPLDYESGESIISVLSPAEFPRIRSQYDGQCPFAFKCWHLKTRRVFLFK